MTDKITVFHPPNAGNGDRTVFGGADIEYRLEDGGALRIMRWISETEMGDALFAPGQWFYVFRSAEALSQGDEKSTDQIKDRISRFIGK